MDGQDVVTEHGAKVFPAKHLFDRTIRGTLAFGRANKLI